MAKSNYLGVDLGGTNVRAGLVDQSRLLDLHARPIRSRGSAADVWDDLCGSIDAVMHKSVAGIGIGVPSLLDPKTGVIFDTVNIPAWKKVPLKARLEKKYRVPVFVDNDAKCFALGERYFGYGRSHENFVGLIVGTGLGAGIITHGQLHSGLFCGAGEFGMIPYKDSILEHYASGQFFRRFNTTGSEMAREAAAGSTKAMVLFNEFGGNLAFAFKVILYALAPEMIVLGGSVSRSFPFYEKALREGLEDFGYPAVLQKTKIKVSRLKEVAVLGAAALARRPVVKRSR